jgi:Na+-transporting methylmalonyl-CoA/oxaloacetate decarboxylase gamma subunit
MTQTMREIAEFLQTFGGWGVAVLFLSLLIYLYRSTNNLLEKRNTQFIEALKETTETLSQSNEQSKRVEAVLTRVEGRLDKN